MKILQKVFVGMLLSVIIGASAVPLSASAATVCAQQIGINCPANPCASIGSSFFWTSTRSFTNGSWCISDSPNSAFVYQNDGNLVFYVNGVAVWNSGTQGRGTRLDLQSDSNVVIYDNAGKPVWALSMQFTGIKLGTATSNNLAIHNGVVQYWTLNGSAVVNMTTWAGPAGRNSDGSCLDAVAYTWNFDRSFAPGQFCFSYGADMLTFQSDGNLVYYQNGQPIWNTQTFGRNAARLAFQSDGNIVVYNTSNQPIWALSWAVPSFRTSNMFASGGYSSIWTTNQTVSVHNIPGGGSASSAGYVIKP